MSLSQSLQVHDAIGYQSKGVFFGSDGDEMSIPPSAVQMPNSKTLDSAGNLKRDNSAKFETLGSAMNTPKRWAGEHSRQRRDPSVALQSVTNIELAEAEATQLPLRLVSDTVRHCQACMYRLNCLFCSCCSSCPDVSKPCTPSFCSKR